MKNKLNKNSNKPSIFNILFGVINILLAIFTIYYNFFRVSDKLQARFTRTEFDGTYENDSLRANAVVINTGNRQGVITDFRLIVMQFNPNSWHGTPLQFTSPHLPIIVEPGKMVLIKVAMPYDYIGSSDEGLVHDTSDTTWWTSISNGDTTYSRWASISSAHIGVEWTAVNSAGGSFHGMDTIGHLDYYHQIAKDKNSRVVDIKRPITKQFNATYNEVNLYGEGVWPLSRY